MRKPRLVSMVTSVASDPLVPAYKKIREALRGRIRDGAYRVGDRLPSESELSREFGVARMTVRQALAQLAFENLIVAQTGRGSFVTARQNVEAMIDATSKLSFEEQISAQGKKSTLKLLSFDAIAAPAEVAERLGLRHPASGAAMSWTSPVPADMVALLAGLVR